MRLIDAKEIERQVKEAFKENPVVMGMLLRWIRKQPTIDAVPVVRCKDCKFAIKSALSGYPICRYFGAEMDKGDFCSKGERKDGDG